MKELSILIKPASSACNLRCSYCFYADITEHRITANHGIMTNETVRIVSQRIAEALNYKGMVNISFQGG